MNDPSSRPTGTDGNHRRDAYVSPTVVVLGDLRGDTGGAKLYSTAEYMVGPGLTFGPS